MNVYAQRTHGAVLHFLPRSVKAVVEVVHGDPTPVLRARVADEHLPAVYALCKSINDAKAPAAAPPPYEKDGLKFDIVGKPIRV